MSTWKSEATDCKKLSLATSLGVEDTVVLELVRRAGLLSMASVFTIDTGRLPEESLQYLETIERHFDISIDVYFPQAESVAALYKEQGIYGFRNSVEERKRCCHVRKVEPLGRALRGSSHWIVGLRRQQAASRKSLQEVQHDEANGITRLAPIIEWSEKEVWDFARDNKLPIHSLHEQGYPSIGCAPCSRSVEGWRAGEENDTTLIRAGRWWWESPEHKECGIHRR